MLITDLISKLYFNPGNRDSGINEQYVEDEVAKVKEGDVEIVVDNEKAIKKKFSGSNSLSKYAQLGRIMIVMLKDFKNGVYPQIPWFTIATLVLVLLYVLNPMDVIPDFIPGLGYIDDVAVLSIGVGWVESDLHRYLDWKIEKGQGI